MGIKEFYQSAVAALQHAEHAIAKIAVRQHAIMLEEWERAFPNTKPEFSVPKLWHLGNDFPTVLINLDFCDYGIDLPISPYRGKGRFMFHEIIDEDSDGDEIFGTTIIIDDKMLNGNEEAFRQELRAIIETMKDTS